MGILQRTFKAVKKSKKLLGQYLRANDISALVGERIMRIDALIATKNEFDDRRIMVYTTRSANQKDTSFASVIN